MSAVSSIGRVGLPAGERYRVHPFSKEIRAAIKALKPDNWHGIAYLVKDYAVIACFIALPYLLGWWAYPVSVLMIGAHQRALSTILHDSAHGVLAENRALNFVLGTFPTAWAIFQRHFAYRISHVQTHHPYLGRVDTDPDLAFFVDEGVFTPMTPRRYIWRTVVLPILGSKTWAYMKYLVRNRYRYLMLRLTGRAGEEAAGKPASARPTTWRNRFDSIGFVVFWSTVIGVCAWSGLLLELVLFWVVPYLTSFHILGWFIELSEHCSCTVGRGTDLFMARNRKSRHVEKWLTGINNDHHHLDHHLDPRTPFWLLPKAHEIRMADPDYARHCAETGGLFQKGPAGEPSILSLILAQNGERLAGREQTASTPASAPASA
ncbi:fatty acid desaturase [Arenibaculum sp.]|uniref:fatty acid desaturase n=1 Tax=Arenibaculum sp. TaxID=2865862 RepID=UPI002E0E7DAF|nr:fatty acid desaturase [Arenibaculum sp.]